MRMPTVAVIGGDERQRYAAEHLRRMGCCVRTWGLFETDGEDPRGILPAEVVLLPLPVTADQLRVAAPLAPKQRGPRFSEVAELLPNGTLLLGGKLPAAWKREADARGLAVIDYAEDPLFQLKNATPTAEGALLLALENLPCTLWGTRVAVTGYGRIASLLADRLRSMGAQTLVLARREESLTEARARGHEAARLINGQPIELPKDCRAVFNTVPYPIFDRASVERFPPACVYIELASLPGGIDLGAAGTCGIRTVRGGGLPGRCFPESAGRIVAETVSAHFPTSNGKNREDEPI
ncbi:MAG TPA: hypothetical protein DDW30_03985 [Clostridiales bacterium]|nr:hypothetical protein [Clostridiales bacterium]